MAKTEDKLSGLRKKVLENKIVKGTNEVRKKLMENQLEKVFISKNCPADIKEELKKICKSTNTEIEETDMTNEELGTVCRRQYSVSVLGVLK